MKFWNTDVWLSSCLQISFAIFQKLTPGWGPPFVCLCLRLLCASHPPLAIYFLFIYAIVYNINVPPMMSPDGHVNVFLCLWVFGNITRTLTVERRSCMPHALCEPSFGLRSVSTSFQLQESCFSLLPRVRTTPACPHHLSPSSSLTGLIEQASHGRVQYSKSGKYKHGWGNEERPPPQFQHKLWHQN